MAHNYTDTDFDGLRFRVDKILTKDYDPIQKFPELAIYPEFSDEIVGELKKDLGKIFTYIVYTYDYKSPFVIYSDNIIKRKKEALENSGFGWSRQTGKYSAIAEDMITCKNKAINLMVIRYCRILRNNDWMTLVGFEEALARQIAEMTSGMTHKDGKEVELTPEQHARTINNVKTLRNEIKELTSDFFSKDTNESLKESIYDSIELDDLNITPEQIAKQMHMGQHPKLYNPYIGDDNIEEVINKHIKSAIQYDTEKQKKGVFKLFNTKADAGD